MVIDWSHVFTGALAIIVLIIVRMLLDLRLIYSIIKYVSWIPVKTFFRKDPGTIAGKWNEIWDTQISKNFEKEEDRRSNAIIWQFSTYCYGEFKSKDDNYFMFGKIKDMFIIGEWGDLKNRFGYFGTFELEIDDNSMKGVWIGHSKTQKIIDGGSWNWERIKN